MFSVFLITVMCYSHCRLRRCVSRVVEKGHMMKVIRENIKLVSWKEDPLDMSNLFPL
jgi:hypothetical protein